MTKETTLNELGEMMAHVVENMATKDDIAALRTELKSDIKTLAASVDQRFDALHAELRSIRIDLNDLADKVQNIMGYRKEIDHALERIAAIERHLGIERKIAA